MKIFFETNLNYKNMFQAFISGYNLIKRYFYNTKIDVEMKIANNAPKILLSLKSYDSVYVNIKSATIRLQEMIKLKIPNDVSLKVLIRIKQAQQFSDNIQIGISHLILSLRERIGSFKFTNIDVGLITRMRLAYFYKLSHWDYVDPNNPSTSPKYLLSELDTMDLGMLDGTIE